MPVFAQQVPAGKLQREMAMRGLKPSQVAAEAGISRATMSRAMNGRPVAVETLLRISNAVVKHVVRPGMAELMDVEEA